MGKRAVGLNIELALRRCVDDPKRITHYQIVCGTDDDGPSLKAFVAMRKAERDRERLAAMRCTSLKATEPEYAGGIVVMEHREI